MAKHFILVLFLLGILAPAVAGVNLMGLTDGAGAPGDTITLSIFTSNSDEYIGFQVDLELLNALEYVAGSAALTTRAGGSHSIIVNQLASGALRVLSFSIGNEIFSGTSGDLASLKFVLKGNPGSHGVNLHGALLSSKSSMNILTGTQSGTVVITGDIPDPDSTSTDTTSTDTTSTDTTSTDTTSTDTTSTDTSSTDTTSTDTTSTDTTSTDTTSTDTTSADTTSADTSSTDTTSTDTTSTDTTSTDTTSTDTTSTDTSSTDTTSTDTTSTDTTSTDTTSTDTTSTDTTSTDTTSTDTTSTDTTSTDTTSTDTTSTDLPVTPSDSSSSADGNSLNIQNKDIRWLQVPGVGISGRDLVISFDEFMKEDVPVFIFNLIGERVNVDIKPQSGRSIQSISLKPGIYILVVIGRNEIIRQKFVIE